MFYQPTDKSVCICILVENARVWGVREIEKESASFKKRMSGSQHMQNKRNNLHTNQSLSSQSPYACCAFIRTNAFKALSEPLTVLFADWYRPKRRFHHIRGESQLEVHSQAETGKEKTENHSKVQWENVSFLFMVLGMKWILSLEKINTSASQPNEH